MKIFFAILILIIISIIIYYNKKMKDLKIKMQLYV